MSVSDAILFHYYWHFISGPEQTAIVQRLSTQNLTIRKCGRRSHHTLRAEEEAKHGRVVQCIIHVFFKDVFIGVLPTVSLKKQPSEQNRESNKIHGKNSTFLFSFSAAKFRGQLKGPYFAQPASPIYSNTNAANHRRFGLCLKKQLEIKGPNLC